MSANFYDLMRYAKTGIPAPDMTAWDKARAMAIGGSKEQTLTGIPPLTFKADGTPLISWSMKGNGQQTGTPTPDTPVMPTFCGVRTAQLFDYQTMAHGTDGMYLDENGNLQSSNAWAVTDFIPCNGSTFTLHKVGGGAPAMCLYDAEKRYIIGKKYNTGGAATKSDITITSQTDAAFIRFSWYRQNDAAQDDVTKLMLNFGSTALPYEPYGYKIPFTCAGQTVPVYLGQTQTVRKIRKLVLDGTENWVRDATDQAPNVLFYIRASDSKVGSAPICTHYKGSVTTTWSTVPLYSVTHSIVSGGIPRLAINTGTDFSDATEFSAYLAAQYAAGTPVTVWYVLATEQTGIVNEPLCKIGDYADELSSSDAAVTIPTIKGQNTLPVDTDLQPSEMTIQYRK